MKLSEKEFNNWCCENQISPETKLFIEKIRSSEPSRRVKSGTYSVSGAFPSRKMGMTIQYESHKNELPFIHELEHDPEVLEFYDQPCKIKLLYKTKSGKNTGINHTPDFFVIKKTEAFFVECKTEEHLKELSDNSPNRFMLDDHENWICPPGEESADALGLGYVVKSSKSINWFFQRNIEFLDDYYRKDKASEEKREFDSILGIIGENPAITLKDLFLQIEKEKIASKDDVFDLIVANKIYVDLYSYLFVEPHNMPVFTDEETAEAYSNITTARLSDHAENKPEVFDLVPGKEILWDGNDYKIINVGEKEIALADPLDNIREIKIKSFENLVIRGKVCSLSKAEEETVSSESLEILLQSDRQSLAEANKRVNYVLRYLEDKEAVKDFTVSERTVQRWVRSYRQSELANGRGYFGLIPKPKNGNGDLKIEENSKDQLIACILEDFETLEGKNRRTVYDKYESECKKRGIIPASYVTFCRYIKERPQDVQTLKREGKRAAYKYEKFYWRLEADTPRHGERPFHIAHIDHTELDIELIDSKTGKNLGRPWLTFLLDAFTRKILAVYLTLNKPSKISGMMVLRECVRRHNRLPQIIVVDGGSDFASTYFETLLALFEVNKKTRPPAKARFGSILERLFRTNDTQFIHNLQGNTKITKNVRQVTKSNDPRNLAIWDLRFLHDKLCEWAYEVYNNAEHSALGQSPNEAFAQGNLNSGNRSHKLIRYDESFRMITLPGTAKGKSKIDYTRGVKINTIYYWSNEFREPGVAGKSVPVKYDPFDMGTAYAYVNKRWCRCTSDYYSSLKGRSAREVYLATEELKKRLNVKSVSLSRLVEFMNSVEDDEDILKQRMMDREQWYVLNKINGDFEQAEIDDYEDQSNGDEPDSSLAVADNVVQFPKTEVSDAPKKKVFRSYPVI